jgi:hypothetical protein
VSVPATVEEACSTEWLSSVLGAQVTATVVGEIDNRVSTNIPIDVELADGRALRVWVKGYFNESGSHLRFAGVPEVNFYSELAAHAGLRTPRCLHAELDPRTSYNVLVTEDVGLDAVFPNGRTPCTADQVSESLAELAALHAATWLHPRAAGAAWLESRLELYTVSRGIAEITQNFDGPIGSGIPVAVRDPQRLLDAFQTHATHVARADPWCVVHGDAHIRNVYLDGGRRPSFIDWQLVQRGPWWIDVGYHIATMLSVADRRTHQDALVAEYLDRLAGAGIARPTDEEVRTGLRRSFVHGFYLWAITVRVEPEAITALLHRLGTAVDDHDAYQELEP